MQSSILITGASGLLGSAISRILSETATIIPLGFTNTQSSMISLDLLNHDDLLSIEEIDWDIIINCAAFRDPDFCELNKEQAQALNTLVPKTLAELAAARGATIIQISTDYVFDGNSPPYHEESPASPINYYGQTKREAEELVEKLCPDSVILRIPVLYGDTSTPARSAFIDGAIEALTSSKPLEIDNCIVRRPTSTNDVAKAIAFFIETKFRGTIHVSSETPTTTYEWTRYIAKLLKMDASHITESKSPLLKPALRPKDSSLSINHLKKIGGPVPQSFHAVLPELNRIKRLIKE